MLRKEGTFITRFQRGTLIYNPASGGLKRRGTERLGRAAGVLREFIADLTLQPTTAPRTAGQLAADAVRNGADLIIAAGGDGTISEVVDGMAQSDVPLAILPSGTANVLAHEVGIRLGLRAAARQIAVCHAERVSLGMVEIDGERTRHFLLMAGVGFDAQVIYGLTAGFKEQFGKLSYFLGGLSRMGTELKEFEVVVNGEARRCTFALISKVRNYGGDFEIASEVSLKDDQFEVVLFEGKNSWRYIHYLAGITTRRLKRYPGVTFLRADHVEVRSSEDPRVYVQADGELVGRIPATLRTVRQALTLMVPPASAR